MRNKANLPQTLVHPLHGGEARPLLFTLAAVVVTVLIAVINHSFA
jgi:hypothetical protein